MSPITRHRTSLDELRSALTQVLSSNSEAPPRIKRLRRRLSVYSSSYTIENVEVDLERGKHLSLVLKDLSPASLLTTAKKVRPDFLYTPLREIQTYRKILQPERLGTPHCYGAVVSPRHGRYWLFLERVRGPLLWQMGRMEFWEEAARWLARLHSRFDASTRAEARSRTAHLLSYDEKFFNIWLTRAEEFMRRKHSFGSADVWRRFGRLADRYDKIIKRQLALPRTFIHGEFYPSNVIMRPTKRGPQICPVDWELAAIAPGPADLAALTSGSWNESQKKKMLEAYNETLDQNGTRRLSFAELTEAVECCQLHIAIQLLGWAPDWSPPERHAQNWLRTAFRLARKLGLDV